MFDFLLVGSLALQESCRLTTPNFKSGFAVGVLFIIGLALYWFLLISPQLQKIFAFFTPTKKDGPSPFNIGVSCMGGLIALILILIATGCLIYYGKPIILQVLGCNL